MKKLINYMLLLALVIPMNIFAACDNTGKSKDNDDEKEEKTEKGKDKDKEKSKSLKNSDEDNFALAGTWRGTIPVDQYSAEMTVTFNGNNNGSFNTHLSMQLPISESGIDLMLKCNADYKGTWEKSGNDIKLHNNYDNIRVKIVDVVIYTDLPAQQKSQIKEMMHSPEFENNIKRSIQQQNRDEVMNDVKITGKQLTFYNDGVKAVMTRQ